VITKTTETTPLISSQSLFPAFNWAEREIWDFFGIFFVNHSDLRRILTDYGFSGYPLRKDFPLSGYQEVYFDDPLKSIEYRVVELSQAFRTFRHTKIWESEV
jgi:NADH:ubiquinone oxidoreductase subunit C